MKVLIYFGIFVTSAFLTYRYMNPPPPPPPPTYVPEVIKPDFAIVLLPHIEATFSELDNTKGRLSDEPLRQVRIFIAAHSDAPGAVEASAICDQLDAVAAQRETFRRKFGTGLNSTSNDYFDAKIARDWLVISNSLAPPVQRSYADLCALQRSAGSKPIYMPLQIRPIYEAAPEAYSTSGRALK